MTTKIVVPKVGASYDVRHQRKGRFRAKVISVSADGSFAKLKVESEGGRISSGALQLGEEVDVNLSMCTLTVPVPS